MGAFGRSEFHLEFVFQVGKRHERIEDIASVLQFLHVFLFVDIVFIANFAHDFFQDVFERHEARSSTIFINDDGELVTRLAQFRQEVVNLLVVGHEHRRHHDFHDVERLGPVFGVPFQEVAVRKDAHDVVHRVLVNGQARMAFAVQDLHQVGKRGIHVDSAHVHTRGHDFAHRGFHEVEDIEDHLLLFFFEALVLTVLHVGKVGLHSIAHLFGQETELRIVAQKFKQLHENHMAELGRGHERQADHPEQRHKNYRQSIRLEARQQVRDENRQHVQYATYHNQVKDDTHIQVLGHKCEQVLRIQEKTEHAGAHVAEDAPYGDAFIEPVPFHEARNLLFALVALLRVTLRENQAERALGRRERGRCQDENAQEYDRENFRILHHARSLYRSSPRNSHSRLRMTLRSEALMWS